MAEEQGDETVLHSWTARSKETPVLSFKSTVDSDLTSLPQAGHAWSSQLNHCIIPPICTLSASSDFPGGLHRPGIKGSGDCGWNKAFLWMVFYSYREGQQACSFTTMLWLIVTHLYTSFSVPESRAAQLKPDGAKDWFPPKVELDLNYAPCIGMSE